MTLRAATRALRTAPRERGASIGVALVVTLLAAVRALDPTTHDRGDFLVEVAAYLCVGLLILSASRAAIRTASIGRRAGRHQAGLSLRVALRALIEAGTVILLALPALAVGWEAGAGSADLRAVTLGLIAAPLYGTACGALFGAMRMPAMPATLLAVAAAALLLWPASLGWSVWHVPRLPGPEVSLPAFLIELSLLAAFGRAILAWQPRRRSRVPRET